VYKIIVTDTSPLITLAVADALDTLLIPGIPIDIPDAVYTEATRVKDAPGAHDIGSWINRNSQLVRIVLTETGIDQTRRLEEQRTIRGMGETAALETLSIFFEAHAHPDDRAVLLFEDTDIVKRRAILDERVSLISTGEFLLLLEHERKIPSAEEILDKAAATGRTVIRQRQDAVHDGPEELREQIRSR
jgi:hypothetical protein